MADANGFEAYEALHRDLEALRDNRLPNIERLSGELRAHISEFQGLLDHKKRSNESRKQLSGGMASLRPRWRGGLTEDCRLYRSGRHSLRHK